jgi:hypothetical protein
MIDVKDFAGEPSKQESEIMMVELHVEQWAHFGQIIHDRLTSQEFIVALNRAGLKASTTRQMARMMRAYLHTGTMP